MQRDPAESEFLLLQAHEIRAALYELTHPDSHILVRGAADREIIAVVLNVEKHNPSFLWRPKDFALADLSQADKDLLHSSTLSFNAIAYGGVRIRFHIQRPEVITLDDGSLALRSSFPEQLSRIQRRKMFRASIVGASVPCAAYWQPDMQTKPINCTIRDISVDGVGLRIRLPVSELPAPGHILENVQLDFGSLGTLQVSAMVENAYPIADQGSIIQTAATAQSTSVAPNDIELPVSHIGASFIGLNARQETWLQQLVWRLEKGLQH